MWLLSWRGRQQLLLHLSRLDVRFGYKMKRCRSSPEDVVDSLWHLKDTPVLCVPHLHQSWQHLEDRRDIATRPMGRQHKPSDKQTFQKMTRQNQKWAHACFSFPIFISTGGIFLLKGRMETREERKLEMKMGNKVFVVGNERKSAWLGAVTK